jgi:hypothetical protein
MDMIRNVVLLGAALFVAPAFAETGVGTIQIDNVASVYGRAGVPAVRISGSVITRSADVNAAGRELPGQGTDRTVVSASYGADQGFGRS